MVVKKPVSQQGFTIVELMIALSVLSTLLVMATVLMIQIGSLYSKGVNQANLQNATRNLSHDITTALQFSGAAPPACAQTPVTTCHSISTDPAHPNPVNYSGLVIYAYCINNTRYSYVMNREHGDDNSFSPVQHTEHVLWRDTMKSNATCYPLDLTQGLPNDGNTVAGTGYEMMPNHMRLTRFKTVESAPGSGIYSVDIWTAYGDSDLVKVDTSDNPATAGQPSCQGGAGTQYCALAKISTTVARRLAVN